MYLLLVVVLVDTLNPQIQLVQALGATLIPLGVMGVVMVAQAMAAEAEAVAEVCLVLVVLEVLVMVFLALCLRAEQVVVVVAGDLITQPMVVGD
jgi:hypothetical protein